MPSVSSSRTSLDPGRHGLGQDRPLTGRRRHLASIEIQDTILLPDNAALSRSGQRLGRDSPAISGGIILLNFVDEDVLISRAAQDDDASLDDDDL